MHLLNKHLALVSVALVASSSASSCRCTPDLPCWASVPWDSLNASVSGRLAVSVDPMAPCAAALNSPACDAVLNASDNEFWLTAQPNGFLHTGLFSVWNISTRLSAFSVLAETEADVAAGVAFAAKYNLRLVIKNTGHDWFTRSSAPGALLVWTHLLNRIAFDAAFDAGCGGELVPAAVIGAGVQFAQLYPAAQAAGYAVVGGTCDSVGAAGCWLGGCYGTFSRAYGSGATNLLAARVALPDGSIVRATACENSDLFFALRGGGGGVVGAVVELTGRAHPAPATLLMGSAGYAAKDDAGWQLLLEMQLNYTLAVMSPVWSGGGVGWSANGAAGDGGGVSFWPRAVNGSEAAGRALLAPFDALVAAEPARFSGSQSWTTWNATSWKPGQTLPWIESHPDREISTGLVASFSRYPVLRAFNTSETAASLAQAIINFTRLMPLGVNGIRGGVDFEKGLAGAPREVTDELLEHTSCNPAVAEASGLLLIMYNVPSLPTVTPSAALMRRLWPRLENYLALAENDPLRTTCAAGAAGDDASAVLCLETWVTERAPPMHAALAVAKEAMWAALPNVDGRGLPFSGSYMHEHDFEGDDWREAQWGDAVYARLLAVKAKYDPDGVFYCHHCVGSEAWDPSGNCRI